MEEFGDECKRRHGKRIIYPSDEWYLKAGRPIPPEEFYEDFDQLENGVGMMRLYASEFLAELEKPHRIYGTKKMDVVTGEMASPLIRQMMDELHRQYPMVEVTVHTIKNKFFGGNVGVAGLVTATDIIAQCEGRLTSGTLGVPAVMLREGKRHLSGRHHHRPAGPAPWREGGGTAHQPAATRPAPCCAADCTSQGEEEHKRKPSPSSLRDATSPEGRGFMHLSAEVIKAPPFGGAGAA